MEAKKVTRYFAECGKGFWNKNSCLNHEKVCKCWKNPKFKTCLSCKHKNFGNYSGSFDGVKESWKQNECLNPKFSGQEYIKPVHKNAEYIMGNCPFWESNK